MYIASLGFLSTVPMCPHPPHTPPPPPPPPHTHTRHATFLRRTRAAVLLQRNARCLVHRRCYLKLRLAATTLQSVFRGKLARTRFTRLLRNSKAGIIQRCMRGWLARQAYRKALRDIVTVQCCAKRWLARRELKRLKVSSHKFHFCEIMQCHFIMTLNFMDFMM